MKIRTIIKSTLARYLFVAISGTLLLHFVLIDGITNALPTIPFWIHYFAPFALAFMITVDLPDPEDNKQKM